VADLTAELCLACRRPAIEASKFSATESEREQ
jgi:hypothetical protein